MPVHHDDHLAELATILAAGFRRVLERKSSQKLDCDAKTPLDCERECGGDVLGMSEDVIP